MTVTIPSFDLIPAVLVLLTIGLALVQYQIYKMGANKRRNRDLPRAIEGLLNDLKRGNGPKKGGLIDLGSLRGGNKPEPKGNPDMWK
jgi:hypothetical protein